MTYRVVYLDRGRRRYLDVERGFTLPHAEQQFRALKRRGFTTWIETREGVFVPTKGAMRQPGFLENPEGGCPCGCSGACACGLHRRRARSERIVNPGGSTQRVWNRVKHPASLHGHALRARVGDVRYDAYETKAGWMLEEHRRGAVRSRTFAGFEPILEHVEKAARRTA